ncbi:MAG: hypothetical protein R2759_04200 [Bacteroidales bacterium]
MEIISGTNPYPDLITFNKSTALLNEEFFAKWMVVIGQYIHIRIMVGCAADGIIGRNREVERSMAGFRSRAQLILQMDQPPRRSRYLKIF